MLFAYPMAISLPSSTSLIARANLQQHITHFIETCSNAGIDGDRLVKQFVRILKGIAFDCYTNLELESTDSWEQMEQEFPNRFYGTQRVVSMTELTNNRKMEGQASS